MGKNITQKIAVVAAGALASGALLLGASTGVASAKPGDCFGIPNCGVFGTGKGGGAYANGKAGGGYATKSAGGAASRGQAGGADNHTP